MSVDNKQALLNAAEEQHIEFTADEHILSLIIDNTRNTSTARSVNNVYKCLALIAGGTGMRTACRLTGISRHTLHGWRSKDWYSTVIELIRKQLDEQLDGKMTYVVNKAINKLDKRLTEGDPVVQRDGTIVYKPVSAKDAAIISSIFIDKRNLLRNKPTSISSTQTTDERLAVLANKFKDIAAGAIDGEYTTIQSQSPTPQTIIEPLDDTEDQWSFTNISEN